jgi:predicted nucleic acid-binding protein
LSIYLDTSFLVALFIEADVFAGRAAAFFAQTSELLIVSDFAAAEFASVVARATRMNDINQIEARAIFAAFDVWQMRFATEEDTNSSDIRTATAIIRRLSLNLRAPAAINLAVAMRLNLSIATFDRGLIANAHALGLPVASA